MKTTSVLAIGFVALAIGFCAMAITCWNHDVGSSLVEGSTVRGLPPLESVFGAQVAGRRVDARALPRYEIELFIAYGGDFTLPSSKNSPMTYRGDRLIGSIPSFDRDRRYLCGVVRLVENTGWHVTECVVQITSGPIRGALVWLAGPPGGGNIGDPYLAWYEMPDGLVEGGGVLEFEVVRFRAH